MKRTALLACLFPLLAPSALAGGEASLNQVWSRLADINGEPGSVESAEFSPDSRYIVTGTKFDNTVRVFRTNDGYQVLEREVPQEIERVAWTRDGENVVSVSEDGFMRVFSVESGDVAFQYQHANGIDGLSASHDGRWMASGQERVEGTGVIRVFETDGWDLAQSIAFPGTVNELDFSSEDRLLAAVGDYTARIYDTSSWEVVQEWSLPREDALIDKHIYINTRFSPDNRHLAVGGTHGFVYIFDVQSGELVRRFNKSGQKTETVEWSKEGDFLLVAGHGNYIDAFRVEQLLDDEIGNDAIPYAFRAWVTDSLEYMDFNSTGTLLTTAHQDGTVQLWTYMSADPLINARGHSRVKEIQARAFEAAGREINPD